MKMENVKEHLQKIEDSKKRYVSVYDIIMALGELAGDFYANAERTRVFNKVVNLRDDILDGKYDSNATTS